MPHTETTEVSFDPQTRKSTEIPASVRQAFENDFQPA
jgi:acyl-CoA thioesterase FadM